MGRPTGAIERMGRRVCEVADLIREGHCPSPAEIADKYMIGFSTAQRTITQALRLCSGTSVPDESGAGRERMMKARRRVVPWEIAYEGGFRRLRVEYGTIWGEAWGSVSVSVPCKGQFIRGRLPLRVGAKVAGELVAMAKRQWGRFKCDLTETQVLHDLQQQEIVRLKDEDMEE